MERELKKVFGDDEEHDGRSNEWEQRAQDLSIEMHQALEQLQQSHDTISRVKQYVLQQYRRHASLMKRGYREAEKRLQLDDDGFPSWMENIERVRGKCETIVLKEREGWGEVPRKSH